MFSHFLAVYDKLLIFSLSEKIISLGDSSTGIAFCQTECALIMIQWQKCFLGKKGHTLKLLNPWQTVLCSWRSRLCAHKDLERAYSIGHAGHWAMGHCDMVTCHWVLGTGPRALGTGLWALRTGLWALNAESLALGTRLWVMGAQH